MLLTSVFFIVLQTIFISTFVDQKNSSCRKTYSPTLPSNTVPNTGNSKSAYFCKMWSVLQCTQKEIRILVFHCRVLCVADRLRLSQQRLSGLICTKILRKVRPPDQRGPRRYNGEEIRTSIKRVNRIIYSWNSRL